MLRSRGALTSAHFDRDSAAMRAIFTSRVSGASKRRCLQSSSAVQGPRVGSAVRFVSLHLLNILNHSVLTSLLPARVRSDVWPIKTVYFVTRTPACDQTGPTSSKHKVVRQRTRLTCERLTWSSSKAEEKVGELVQPSDDGGLLLCCAGRIERCLLARQRKRQPQPST